MHAAAGTVAGFGWGPKLRILIAFYQCVTAIGPLYLVPLPSEYQEILDAFDFLNTDWLGFMLPAECVGSFESRMLLSAAAPLLLVVIIIVGELVAHGRQRKPLKGGLLSSISPCLLVVFIFAPGVNRKIFEAWDCVPYELSSTQSHYFLRRSPLIRCSSSEHDSLLALAYTLVVIWPVGSVALFTMLIAWVHRRLVSYRRDEFILATQFLHAPFTPEHSFWSSVELAQRCILTGWVLLIRADKSFMRLVFALLTALIVLVCTLTLHPYRRADDNMLAVASSLLLLLVYTASIFIKAFEDFNLAVTSLYLDAALTPRVLGFRSMHMHMDMDMAMHMSHVHVHAPRCRAHSARPGLQLDRRHCHVACHGGALPLSASACLRLLRDAARDAAAVFEAQGEWAAPDPHSQLCSSAVASLHQPRVEQRTGPGRDN